MFLHKNKKENGNIVKKDTKLKCDTCKFDNFEDDQVKQHEIVEHMFMLCLNCDKQIYHKEIILSENFHMKTFLSVRFRDTLMKEIDKMVNYYSPSEALSTAARGDSELMDFFARCPFTC